MKAENEPVSALNLRRLQRVSDRRSVLAWPAASADAATCRCITPAACAASSCVSVSVATAVGAW